MVVMAGLLSRRGDDGRRSRRSVRRGFGGVGRDPQSFDDFADRYDRRDELTGGWITEWLHGILVGRGGESAVDLGCGTGRVAAELAGHYEHVRAVDLSQSMIDLARRKRRDPRITFEQGDLTEVTGQYDLVVSVMALHHVPDLPAALRRMSELATPGGLVVLIDAAKDPPRSRWHLLYWNLKALIGDIGQAFEKFRLTSDLKWMDHLVSDRLLSPAEFVATFQEALPGVVITPESGLYTAVWQCPSNGP